MWEGKFHVSVDPRVQHSTVAVQIDYSDFLPDLWFSNYGTSIFKQLIGNGQKVLTSDQINHLALIETEEDFAQALGSVLGNPILYLIAGFQGSQAAISLIFRHGCASDGELRPVKGFTVPPKSAQESDSQGAKIKAWLLPSTDMPGSEG